jgi:hypothetical protein
MPLSWQLNLTAAAMLVYFFALLKNKLALTMFCLCCRIITCAPELSPLATSIFVAGARPAQRAGRYSGFAIFSFFLTDTLLSSLSLPRNIFLSVEFAGYMGYIYNSLK